MTQSMTQDMIIVRKLAARLREIAGEPWYAEKRRRWAEHNDLTGDKQPLLWICPDDDGGWRDLIPSSQLLCAHPDLRALEWQLRKWIFHHENLADDFAQEPVVRFDLPGEYTGYLYGSATQTRAWGVGITPMGVGANAYHLPNYLEDPVNVERLLAHEVDFLPDEARLSELRSLYEEAVDGAVRVQFTVPYCALVQSLFIDLVHLRGLSELMLDFYDRPEWLHAILDHMSASKARLLDKLERERLLYDNRSNLYTGSGGLGYTQSPPVADRDASVGLLWGFADAQELSGVSPAMFQEFALPYQSRGLSKFGMACYGCCEPLDDRFDMIFAALPNVRRLSVSPWCDVGKAAEAIGSRAVYSWKPNPALLSVPNARQEQADALRRFRRATRDRCHAEVILKDIRTCTLEELQAYAELFREIMAE